MELVLVMAGERIVETPCDCVVGRTEPAKVGITYLVIGRICPFNDAANAPFRIDSSRCFVASGGPRSINLARSLRPEVQALRTDTHDISSYFRCIRLFRAICQRPGAVDLEANPARKYRMRRYRLIFSQSLEDGHRGAYG